MVVKLDGGEVAKGFFGSMPSEKLMTIGGVGFIGSFAGNYLELDFVFYSATSAASIILLLLGFYGTVIRAQKEHELSLEISQKEHDLILEQEKSLQKTLAQVKADAEDRRKVMRPKRLPSGRTVRFSKLIDMPMTSLEISSIDFPDDDKLTKAEAIRKVKLARGVDAGVPAGLVVELPEGKYISRDYYSANETVNGAL
jgi:hypothetical protein|tara:strand:- start:310 stop:903 length:594 start_codon:yes stop_codon:yes gene_type:complete